MRPQPMLVVTDVEASSRFYQHLLGVRSAHGGAEYERLLHDGRLVLQLHRFDVGHHHGQLGDPDDRPYGNGVLLWFEVDDLDAAVARAASLQAEIVLPTHKNPPEGDGGPDHRECWLRDPDGYLVVLASPDGEASGSHRRPARLWPQLAVRDGRAALRYYVAALGAEVVFQVGGTDEHPSVVAQLAVGDAVLWVADEAPEHGSASPEALGNASARLLLVVHDPDAGMARALAAGATLERAVVDEHGWRVGRVRDPFGHHWELARPPGGWPGTT